MIDRRTVLKGLGTAMALPLMESLSPAQDPKPPLRMSFIYFPNGADMKNWSPAKTGTEFTFPKTLEPLAAYRKDLLLLSGLTHDKARANGDGPGDHARSTATFLTGAQAFKTAGRNIKVGVSVDQIAAQKIGNRTVLPSLEMGIEGGALSGNCDSGYSCAYSSNISWRTPSQPMTKEVQPRLVFERLFGDPDQAESKQELAKRMSRRRSILDLVREDARSLQKNLSSNDRGKLDEYLESVRSVEEKIQAGEKMGDERPRPTIKLPRGIPRDLTKHIRIMMDLLVLAFQTDTTRINTFMLGNAGSNRTFPWLGVREGHHNISHHSGNRRKIDQIQKIDHYYVQQFAYLVDRLTKTADGAGKLIDNVMILYGCAIADGNRHNHDNLPVIIAGHGGGSITPGRHVRQRFETPMANLFLSMLDRMGVREGRFGDSMGRLKNLKA